VVWWLSVGGVEVVVVVVEVVVVAVAGIVVSVAGRLLLHRGGLWRRVQTVVVDCVGAVYGRRRRCGVYGMLLLLVLLLLLLLV